MLVPRLPSCPTSPAAGAPAWVSSLACSCPIQAPHMAFEASTSGSLTPASPTSVGSGQHTSLSGAVSSITPLNQPNTNRGCRWLPPWQGVKPAPAPTQPRLPAAAGQHEQLPAEPAGEHRALSPGPACSLALSLRAWSTPARKYGPPIPADLPAAAGQPASQPSLERVAG